jgi:bifunctional DNA-binding transcriptional regulator/antitoxin component of YhaV-PrlF toxin-antitoxin module
MSSGSLQVEFLTTTQVDEKGQLTVPNEYRGALQLEKGAQVAVLRLGGALLLIPEQAYFRQLCDRIASVFSNLGVTEVDILSTLPGARQRVFERRYPELAKPAKKQRSKMPARSVRTP